MSAHLNGYRIECIDAICAEREATMERIRRLSIGIERTPCRRTARRLRREREALYRQLDGLDAEDEAITRAMDDEGEEMFDGMV